MNISTSSDFIKKIRKNPENFYIIHYSCQSLYDDNEGLSPRITSIAINHVATQQTMSFSTHAIAEELNIVRDDVYKKFDEIERDLLSKFYSFVRDRRDKYWVHWNMRNLTYGFEHLEHRYRTLGQQDAPVIPIERRINLSDILSDRYGSKYAKHPKMRSLMEMNGGIHRHFLTGEEEVQAFRNGGFIRMHNSTLCKAGLFHRVIERMLQGKLRTISKGWGVMLDRLYEGRQRKMFGFVATLLAFGLGIIEVLRLIF